MAERFPAIFVSHGAPLLAIQPGPAREFLSGKSDDLVRYRSLAPEAARNHPTEEHFLPLFVPAGAASPGVAGKRIHRSHTFGILAMDAYRFD